jgi:hypothetical protein
MNLCCGSLISFENNQKKKNPALDTTLKIKIKINLVQDIKGGCSPCPIIEEENTFH